MFTGDNIMKFYFTVMAIYLFVIQNVQNKAKPIETSDLKSTGVNRTITPDTADVLSKEGEAYMKEIQKNNHGFKLVEGDMILDPNQQKSFGNNQSNSDYGDDMDQALISSHWPNNRIYYTFDKTVNKRFRKYIRSALSELRVRLVGCIQFVEDVSNNYVSISAKRNRQCVSMVGVNKAGKNTLNLDEMSCKHRGVIQHELIHSLGIFHHQARKDRDKYIKINWKNIITKPENYSRNFQTQEAAELYNLPYDYASIMHYGGTFFSKRKFGPNKLLTIETRNPKYQNVLGRQDHISDGDIRLIKTHYGCKMGNKVNQVSCGDHNAGSCAECGPNAAFCNGNCKWERGKCTGDDKCVTDGGEDIGSKCIFPFIYKATKYNGCTSTGSSQLWCSTSVDKSGGYVKHKWGNCASSCKLHVEDDKCVTDGGKDIGSKCIFPFIFKGTKYNGCTSTGWSQLWCSTSVDDSGGHVTNKWGNCASSCKLHSKG